MSATGRLRSNLAWEMRIFVSAGVAFAEFTSSEGALALLQYFLPRFSSRTCAGVPDARSIQTRRRTVANPSMPFPPKTHTESGVSRVRAGVPRR